MADPLAPNDTIARTVIEATTALSEDLSTDPAAAWQTFTPTLQDMLPQDRWQATRVAIDDRTGPRREIRVHGLTFYAQDALLAAVDFAQPFADASGAICGFVLWQIEDADAPRIARIEENIVEIGTITAMPVDEAAQTMTEWRCPPAMIEAILGVSISE